eukprot:1324484-Amorphochlora_amoeboformis.AAC.1
MNIYIHIHINTIDSHNIPELSELAQRYETAISAFKKGRNARERGAEGTGAETKEGGGGWKEGEEGQLSKIIYSRPGNGKMVKSRA